MDLLAALLGAGGLSAKRAARILHAELSAVEAGTEGNGLDAVAGMSAAARRVLQRLAGLAESELQPGRDILVLDSDEVTGDLVALAIEAEGHSVRVAATLPECLALFNERRPDLILTEAHIPGAPVDQLCRFLRERFGAEVPIVLFAAASGAELALLCRNAGATQGISKDAGIEEMIAALNALFDEILW